MIFSRDHYNKRPSVSVIIPTFNRCGFVGDAIQSILDQTSPVAEILVVDDGSKDDTLAVLAGFGNRVKVIAKANGGKSTALNIAMELVSGEFVWIFDDDDIAVPTALEMLLTPLTLNPEYGFAFGSYDHLVDRGTGKFEVVAQDLKLDESVDVKLSIFERCYVFQPGLLVRKRCYEVVGRFDESLIRSQDYEMLLRLARRFKGVSVGKIVFHQRQHQGVRGTANAPVQAGQMIKAWIRNDSLVFGRLYEAYGLADYLPGHRQADSALDPPDRLGALLQRCCIMARKGIWDRATDDLTAAAEVFKKHPYIKLHSTLLSPLTRIFMPYSYAEHTVADSGDFFARLRSFSFNFRSHIMWALLQPMFREMQSAIRLLKFKTFLVYLRKLALVVRMSVFRSASIMPKTRTTGSV